METEQPRIVRDLAAEFSLLNKQFAASDSVDTLRLLIRDKPQEAGIIMASYLEKAIEVLKRPLFDKRLSEVIATFAKTLETELCQPVLFANVRSTAINNWGVSNKQAFELFPNLDNLYIYPMVRSPYATLPDTYILICHPEYLRRLRRHPIRGLATIASAASYMHDFVNGKAYDGQFAFMRAAAWRSQFLLDIMEGYPDTDLPKDLLKIVNVFPQGIDTAMYGGEPLCYPLLEPLQSEQTAEFN